MERHMVSLYERATDVVSRDESPFLPERRHREVEEAIDMARLSWSGP